MNVIDALVVTLGMDASGYKRQAKEVEDTRKKMSDAENKHAKESEQHQKKNVEGLSNIKTGLLEVLAVVAGGMGFKAFIADSVNGQAALHRMSQNLGMNVKDIEAWGVVAKGMGANAQDAYAALQTVAGGMAEAGIKGHSGLTDAARANGISLQDSAGKWLSNAGVMMAISQRMHQMPRQQAMWLASQLGVGAMANTLLLPQAELQRYLNQAKSIAAVTDLSAANAARLQLHWALLQERFKAIRDTAWNHLEPVLEKLGNRLADWMDKIDWDKVIGEVQSFISALGGLKTIAIVLGGVFALKLLSPLTGMIGLFSRLIPLIASTTAGFSAMAVAAAGAAGYLFGHEVYKHALAGTSAGDAVGETAGVVMALAGNKKAIDAVNRERRAKEIAAMTPAQHAQWEQLITAGHHPEKAASAIRGKHYSASERSLWFSMLEKKTGLPAGLLASVEKTESGGNVDAISSAGAVGAFQGLPSTAKEFGLSVADLHDELKSAAFAAYYLAKLRKQNGGDIHKALSAYNEGQGNLNKYGESPTNGYASGILARLGTYGSGSSRTSTSTTHIDHVSVVLPNATDAQGIAMQLPGAMAQQSLIQASNRGME